jgi:hypothetical protein
MKMTAAQLDIEINELHKKATEDLRRQDIDFHVAAAVWHQGQIVRALTVVPIEVMPDNPEELHDGAHALGALMAQNMPSGPLLAVVIAMPGYLRTLAVESGDTTARRECIITSGCDNSGHMGMVMAFVKERADTPLDIAGWAPALANYVEVRKRACGDVVCGRVIGVPPESETYQVLASDFGIIACDLEELNPYPSEIVIGEVSTLPPKDNSTPGPNGLIKAFWDGWSRVRQKPVSAMLN